LPATPAITAGLACIAAACLTSGAASTLADETPAAGAAPLLRPSIIRWEGPYAGIIAGGHSVSIDQADGVTGVKGRRVSGLAGATAGYLARVRPGPAPAFWGVEADVMSLARLNGKGADDPAWLASACARYGVNLAPDLLVYGTAGLAMTSQDANAGRISPALIGGFGVESAGSGNMRTRLEYLYSLNGQHQDAHIVRAALILNLR
jgi:opacity protein-like surface antigen